MNSVQHNFVEYYMYFESYNGNFFVPVGLVA